MPTTVDFHAIRSYNGSQDRALEELCFQLIPSLCDLPSDAVLRRHGTPDGGVEAKATLPSGEVWAWQAKYLFRMGSGEFQQLDKSVKSALDSTPNLVRYTFCVPYDPPANAPKGKKSAMTRLQEHVDKWRNWAAKANLTVEFEYVGESQLLNALMPEKHRGLILYWFDAEVLNLEWFRRNLNEALEEAGPRYSPELSVDLPISKVFEGLGRTKDFEATLRRALREVRGNRRFLSLTSEPAISDEEFRNLLQEVLDALDRIDEHVMSLEIVSPLRVDFNSLVSMIGNVNILISKCMSNARRAEEELQKGDRAREYWRAAEWELGKIMRALIELREITQSDSAKLLNVPALLVVGPAGSGKTHLFCDVARRRVDKGQPTVILLGQRFSTEEPWTQVLKQLGLNCTVDEFLGALSAAAEASDTRTLIFLDAINEGQGTELWPNYLASFIQKIRQYPRLGLALSCRASYRAIVIPESLDSTKLVTINHYGFAGREFAAVKAFFSHYELQLPDFPLLVPEFSNPLFLKLMCRSLHDRRIRTLPRGETGVSALFEGFLSAAEERLSRPERCNFALREQVLSRAIKAIAAAMLQRETDFLSSAEAATLTNDVLPHSGWEGSLLKGMIDEGILSQDVMPSDEGHPKNIISFAYQRLSDYLRAREFLNQAVSLEAVAGKSKSLMSNPWNAYVHSGLLEALAVQVPEKYGVELPDLLDEPFIDPVPKAYLESLVWRSLEAFPQSMSLDYLNKLEITAVFGTFLQVACVPGHPLNANRLHESLWPLALPVRDQAWTTFINWETDDESIVSRIIHWAWLEDTSMCSDDAVLLCAVTLAWFLTSSNRYIRDTATKALVAVLTPRPHVLTELLNKFLAVNDPYVSERLYAVAYGCAMRITDRAILAELAAAVYSQVFKAGKPPIHVLLRDYARGVIERAINAGCSLELDVSNVRPPYASPWPIRTKAPARLDSLYDKSNGWHAIRASVLNLGDFHRYVLESSIRDFLAPNQAKVKAKTRRLARQQAADYSRRFAESLTTEQSRALQEMEQRFKSDLNNGFNVSALLDYWRHLGDILSEEQQTLKRKAEGYQNQIDRNAPVYFDVSRASYWILGKVLELGWRPARFESFDRGLRTYHIAAQRIEHRHERIGKKYQWIALHELLARMGDHCLQKPRWGDDSPGIYDGAWDGFRRDIDPSFIRPSTEATNWDPSPVTWWSPRVAPIPEVTTSSDRTAWLLEEAGIPDPEEFIRLSVPLTNKPAYTLEGSYHWEETEPPEMVPFTNDRCHCGLQIRAYLIRKAEVQAFSKWAAVMNWKGRWMPESDTTYKAFLGEEHWHPSVAEYTVKWIEGQFNGEILPGSVLVPCTAYGWERGYDNSIGDTVGGSLPSSALARVLELKWEGNDFKYSNPAGQTIAFDPSSNERGPQALIVDGDAFRQVCSKENLTVLWTVLGEKNVYGSHVEPSTAQWTELYGAYLLNEDGSLSKLGLNYSLRSNAMVSDSDGALD
jgi:hypothetical protein